MHLDPKLTLVVKLSSGCKVFVLFVHDCESYAWFSSVIFCLHFSFDIWSHIYQLKETWLGPRRKWFICKRTSCRWGWKRQPSGPVENPQRTPFHRGSLIALVHSLQVGIPPSRHQDILVKQDEKGIWKTTLTSRQCVFVVLGGGLLIHACSFLILSLTEDGRYCSWKC